ncbi:MAG: hypothetical protein GY757_30255 [bacterium]|nr:hypothetical protein [bacterium]
MMPVKSVYDGVLQRFQAVQDTQAGHRINQARQTAGSCGIYLVPLQQLSFCRSVTPRWT